MLKAIAILACAWVDRALLTADDGVPLSLQLTPTYAGDTTPSRNALPNCMTVASPFDPAETRSAALATATAWPEFRTATLELQLELENPSPRPQALTTTINFEVRIREP